MQAEPRYRIADLTFDPVNRTFERDSIVSTLPNLSFQLLHCLVRHAPDTVDFDTLNAEVWGSTIVSPETLTQRVKLLRDAIGDDHQNPRYIETKRGHGYRLIPAVEPLTAPAHTPVKSTRIRLASIGVVAVVAGLIFVLNANRTENAHTTPPSIAVLPFVNMSSDPDQEYFSDGLSEELLNVLSQIPGLQVSARTSSFQFKGKNLDVVDIGRQLNTGFILEGSVRKEGSQVRVTAQLVDASNGFHLWSEAYDRELEGIFALQNELSASIVTALKDHLDLQIETTPPIVAAANTSAHEAYLRGRFLFAQDTDTAIEQAIREFETSLSYDPDYALAHAELALATLSLRPKLNVQDAITRAKPHIERALELDPTLAEAHAANGYVLWFEEQWEDALAQFRRAVQLNPNSVFAYVWMGNLLSWKLGRYDEAFQMREAAMRLDPLSIQTIVFYLQALIERNRIDEARQELEKIKSIYPHVYAYRHGSLESRGGNIANAVLGSLDALKISPEFSQVRLGLTYRFAELGLEDEIFAIQPNPKPLLLQFLGNPQKAVKLAEDRLAQRPDSIIARHDLGLALAAAGDYARARAILEEMWRLSAGRISKRSDLFTTLSAAALIAIRRDAGDEAAVDEIVAAIRDNVRRYQKAGIVGDGRSYGVDFEEGLALYLSGDRERGLELLDKGTAGGVFIPPNEAYLKSLYEDPGFAPVLARQQARQVREREKFLSIVCFNSPYDAVWRPAPGTCEQFAALR
ncbi:MAG: winged helix-turn-helix domain-containing protein [Woeseiaceae bacterium]|nr:winged helix-turn-helix domain-containing protein [Woeseiaceae bacterium]